MDYKDVVSSLQLLSKRVVPLKQRKARLRTKIPVVAVAGYKSMQVCL